MEDDMIRMVIFEASRCSQLQSSRVDATSLPHTHVSHARAPFVVIQVEGGGGAGLRGAHIEGC
eukprot:7166539-Alexandrium_andersonii.AAC.1